MGFVRSQVAGAVQASALTMTIVSVVLGIPIGLAIGRSIWTPIAHSAFVAGDTARPGRLLALIGPVALVLALCASALPAVRASRMRPAEILRTE